MNHYTILVISFLLNATIVFSACPVVLERNFPVARRSGAGGNETHEEGTQVIPFSTGNSTTSRIVNGVSPTGQLRRYIVDLRVEGEHSCTGTIINKKYILSAAHCEMKGNPIGWQVHFYSRTTKKFSITRKVKKVILHPDFLDENVRRQNDIMLMELEGTAPKSAAFVRVNWRKNIPEANAYARAAGFGITADDREDSGTLHQVDLPTRTSSSCKNLEPTYLKRQHICAAYKCGGCDTCHGDSGGPLFQFTKSGFVYQIGITAYGRGGDCAVAREPGVYTRVSSYHGWILDNIAESGEGIFENGNAKQIIADRNECPDI